MRNTKIIWILVWVLWATACREEAKKTNHNNDAHTPVEKVDKKAAGPATTGISLRGSGLADVSRVILYRKDLYEGEQPVGEAEVHGGTFEMTLPAELPGDIYYLRWKENGLLPLLWDGKPVELVFADGRFREMSGDSPARKLFSGYLSEWTASGGSFGKQKEFVTRHPDSEVSLWILKSMLGPTPWRLEQTQDLYEKISGDIKNTGVSREIAAYFERYRDKLSKEQIKQIEESDPEPPGLTGRDETAPSPPVSEGDKPASVSKPKTYVPYFYAYDLEGNEVSAKEIFNRNKVVYIDFWASWCVPCRNQNPDLLRLYNRYKDKGFEIISVSQDKDAEKCRNAVLQDGITWTNVMDPGANVAVMYEVHSIPDGFVVDHEGGIIAKNVGAGRLEEILIRRFSR